MNYLINVEGTSFYKVGYSKDIEGAKNRLASMQTGSPYRLRLVAQREGGREEEAAIHSALADYWVRGEWFKVTNDDTEAVKVLEDAFDINASTGVKYDIGPLKAKRVPPKKKAYTSKHSLDVVARWMQKGGNLPLMNRDFNVKEFIYHNNATAKYSGDSNTLYQFLIDIGLDEIQACSFIFHIVNLFINADSWARRTLVAGQSHNRSKKKYYASLCIPAMKLHETEKMCSKFFNDE